MLNKVKYPIYLKSSFGTNLYKIVTENEFEEIQLVGEKAIKINFTAMTFFDNQLIQDMIDLKDNRWEVVNEIVYSEALSRTSQV